MTTTPTPPPTDSASAHYAHYLPLALTLPAPTSAKAFRTDVSLANLNAARGVEVVLAHATELAAALPQLDLDAVRTLGDLGSAVAYAQAQVARFAAKPTGTTELLGEARRLRALLIASADVLVLKGVVPAASVAKIRAGSGQIDTAGDCVALAALFAEHDEAAMAVGGVTAGDLANAASVGSRLLRVLRPATARRAVNAELGAATTARDRLWQLFEQTWRQQVWRAGAWLFDRAVEQHVPLLHSRVGGRR